MSSISIILGQEYGQMARMLKKVLILVEAERFMNCPHPEVGRCDLPSGWEVLPVDSNLWLSAKQRKRVQLHLTKAKALMEEARAETFARLERMNK
jgi:hypothetical protein